MFGYLYPRHGRRVLRAFEIVEHGPGNLPEIYMNTSFASSGGPTRTHSARVNVGGVDLLVVGKWKMSGEEDDVNEAVLSIKPTTVWWGEVATFVFGKRGSLLAYPRVGVKTHDKAVNRKVSFSRSWPYTHIAIFTDSYLESLRHTTRTGPLQNVSLELDHSCRVLCRSHFSLYTELLNMPRSLQLYMSGSPRLVKLPNAARKYGYALDNAMYFFFIISSC